ncbi:MAG: hypothetical protein B6244_10745 [Candidatus Cloacimonetes bacterium 4572_55]|nr:MAG: hypothetical protein B6244_10745 [Candidatus Cloacimonetes bacterium 4572_55]
MIKLPYGISNFEKLINDGYYFVDKTLYINELENLNESYIIFLRPRRFGKSLFVSMLSYYYDVARKEKFTHLFGKFAIGKQPTKKANKYLILNFDFSQIDTQTKETAFTDFRKNVLIGVKKFCLQYELTYEYFENIDKPANIIKTLFVSIQETKLRHKIYILIDEYDHFANEMLSSDPNAFSDIVSRTGFVRKFYESIKYGTYDGIVDRMFVTGVTPITLDSMTSGFNIAQNDTLDEDLNAMMGFTESETRRLLQTTCRDYPGDIDDLFKMMKDYYNGYCFNQNSSERIFNPDMALYFLNHLTKGHKYRIPKQLIDTNISSDYSKIARLFQLGNLELNLETLNELIIEKNISAQLTAEFSLQKEFDRDDFISLLFYMGIITIKQAALARINFCVPNYVVTQLYLKYFARVIEDRHQIKLKTDTISSALEAMALHNNLAPFIKVVEELLKVLSFQDFKRFDEKYIKVAIVSYLSLTNLYFIKSEYELGGGYVDLLLLTRPPVIPNYQFAIELKYMKKSEGNQLSKRKRAAITQLKGYLATKEARSMSNLRGYTLIFVGDECRVCEAVHE